MKRPRLTNSRDPRIDAVQYFVDRGMTPHGAIGLVGNLYRESNLSPDSVNSSSGAYGIAQWLGSRKKTLFDRYGNKPTFELLLEFVWDELNSTHKRGLKMLNASKDVEEAARNGMGFYEFSVGPEGAIREMNKYGQNGQRSMDEGIRYANEIYQLYTPRMQGKPTSEEAKLGIRPNASKRMNIPVRLNAPVLSKPTTTSSQPTLVESVDAGRSSRRKALFLNMMELSGLSDMLLIPHYGDGKDNPYIVALKRTLDPREQYDYIGYLSTGGSIPPKQGSHYPDTFKLPGHPTFSDESIYNTPEHPGGHWHDDHHYEHSDYTFQHSDETLEYLKQNDPGVISTYKGGIVIPSITVRGKAKPRYGDGKDRHNEGNDFIHNVIANLLSNRIDGYAAGYK